eukprot:scaffold34395_cov31-Tisochrysis_lutea.AAC.1
MERNQTWKNIAQAATTKSKSKKTEDPATLCRAAQDKSTSVRRRTAARGAESHERGHVRELAASKGACKYEWTPLYLFRFRRRPYRARVWSAASPCPLCDE